MLHKKVRYGSICSMIQKVVVIKNEPLSLKALVSDLSRHTGLGIDASRVKEMLGDKVVEMKELDQGVLIVTDMVIP